MNKGKIKIFSIFLVLFLFNQITTNSQTIPDECFDGQNDFSYMWWLKTIKSKNKIFGIKTNKYNFSFDYESLSISNFIANDTQNAETDVLTETNEESFNPTNPCQISFGMTSNERIYTVQAYAQNIEDCQLIETGKYFHRRFINNLVDLNGCNLHSSGLEISSWPDRIAFILRATPKNTLENRGLYIEFIFPVSFSEIIQSGELIALKNPQTGSGYIILKSEKASELLVNNTKVTVNLEKIPTISAGQEINVGLIIYPIAKDIEAEVSRIDKLENQSVSVTAIQIAPSDKHLDVTYSRDHGWHHIALRNDGDISEYAESSNNRIERVKLSFDNPSSIDKTVRLNFAKGRLSEKNSSVFGITGISAILRDGRGNPIGIPVQISKNWHTSGINDEQYFRGPWYHGLCVMKIPANSQFEMEYTSINALWGNVPAASHAQLCLVGWGSNQQWDQSAIGSWGESITYEPDLVQASAPVLDFRPLMIKNSKNQKWGWTGNMGGADFFNYTKTSGIRGWHSRIRTQYKRYGPNLTEVTYAGTMDDNSMDFEYTASIGRSDDIVRGIYIIRLKVLRNTEFKDFVFFQVAAPTYHYTKSNTLAWGNENGIKKQWKASIGGSSRYISPKLIVDGDTPWFSFADSQFAGQQPDFRPANRGFVIRSWKARINGRDNILPYYAEYNATGGHGEPSSLINITPPADCTSFMAGDYIEAVIELIQIPKTLDDYYGPNQNLINALRSKSNTWEMVYCEAIGNDLDVVVVSGASLINRYPIKIENNSNSAYFSVSGGVGYVPITITNVTNFSNAALYQKVNGSWKKIDQSVYGNDYWQTDYNALTGKWEITYNVNLDSPNDVRQTIDFKFEETSNVNSNTMLNNNVPNMRIYPNPTNTGWFSIEFSEVYNAGHTKVKIFDISGKQVLEKHYQNNSSLAVSTNLSDGFYFVIVDSEHFSKSGKLVIQKG